MSDRPVDAAAQGRAARAWSAYLSVAAALLLWKYVNPWAAWGYSMFLLALAVYFDFGQVRHG